MLRKPITTFLLLVALHSLGQPALSEQKIRWYNFYWGGDSLYPRDAIMLKSSIDTLNFSFNWQFDTGSPRTFAYGKPWQSFLNTFPWMKDQFYIIDSFRQDGYINVNNRLITFSGSKLPKNVLGVMPDYGDNIPSEVILANFGADVTIGTIGIDVFRQGVLALDLKNSRIGYSPKLTDQFYTSKLNTIDFIFYQNRIIVPVEIDGQIFYFFYDSGASLFPLKTTARFTDKLPSIKYTDTLRNITTWGKSYDVPGGIFDSQVKIGSMQIMQPKIYVHPDPEKYHTGIFEEAEATGLIGNEYFYNKILLIDFTRMKMTIID